MESSRGKNRRTEQQVATAVVLASCGRHCEDSQSQTRHLATATPCPATYRVVTVGGGVHDSHRLFLCDLQAFLVMSSLLLVVFAPLNLLPIKVNKTSKNPKDYINKTSKIL